MKKTTIISMIIIFASVSFLLFNCNKKAVTVAKIDSQKINLDEFNVRFEYYLKSKYVQQPDYIPRARNDMEERRACLKDMINENLILNEAKKLKLDKKEDVKNLIKLYTQQIIINAYIEQYLAGDIKVSKEEVEQFYRQNKSQFAGVEPELALKKIEYQLTLQKYDKKISEILDNLKGKYRIDINENAIRPIMGGGLGETTGQDKETPSLNIPKAQIKTNK